VKQEFVLYYGCTFVFCVSSKTLLLASIKDITNTGNQSTSDRDIHCRTEHILPPRL